MKLKAVSGIMLILLLIATFELAFHVQLTKAEQEPQLLLETDKDIYILGEKVTITLTNIGNESIVIGGYPAWEIYSYPEEEPVYPTIFLTLLWWLDPGENDTITWNQYNAFTESFVEPGAYVVRDIQGWGLSAYFKIIAAVPDNYEKIQ